MKHRYYSSGISPSRRREVATGISAGPISDSVRHWCMVSMGANYMIVSYSYIHENRRRKSLTKRLSPRYLEVKFIYMSFSTYKLN